MAGAGCISCTLKAHCPGAVRGCPPCSGQQGKCSARCCPCSHALVLQCCLLVVRIISWRMCDLLHSGLQPSDTARVARLRKQHVGPNHALMYAEPLHIVRGEVRTTAWLLLKLVKPTWQLSGCGFCIVAMSHWRSVFVLQGATLWAADGTSYLDCVNNVAHVGHCNVKVSLCTRHVL